MTSPVKIIKDFLIVAVLAYSVTFGLAGFAQETQDPGKDEKTVTMKIVKDDNGKVTVIDTTFTTKGKGKGKQYEYEYTIQNMDKQMADVEREMQELEDHMKHFDVEVKMGDAFENMDPRIWIGGDEDVFMPRMPMPPQWEALMQSIPKGNIKGFQIKDRKDGKRIIIDIDDEMPMVIMAPYIHRGMGHGKGHGAKKIIIERDMKDMNVPPPPPPPPPPPADQKEQGPKPEKG